MELVLALLLLIGFLTLVDKLRPRAYHMTLDRTKECPPFGPAHVWFRDPSINDNLRCKRCNRTFAEVLRDS